MKRIFVAVFLVLTLAGAGCTQNPTTGQVQMVSPKTPLQTVYAAEVSLTTAVNALADLHQKGVVVGPNYDHAKTIEKQAHATLTDAKAAATAKDATKTSVLLITLTSLIDQLAVYNGGVK